MNPNLKKLKHAVQLSETNKTASAKSKSTYDEYAANMRAYNNGELSEVDWASYCEVRLHQLMNDHADVFKRLKARSLND